jgi:hypothetical protein
LKNSEVAESLGDVALLTYVLNLNFGTKALLCKEQKEGFSRLKMLRQRVG